MFGLRGICELLMSKLMVGVIMFVVIAMFFKGMEVLGPSNTNYTIKYDGPETTTEHRWKAAFEWGI